MSPRAGALVAVVVLAVAGWLLTRPEVPAPPHAPGQVYGERPIAYRIDGFDVTRMTVDGRPAHRLVAPRLEHFRDEGTSLLTTPSLTVFGEGQTPAWQIEAREALLSQDGTILTLSGDVVIERPAGATMPAMRIETQRLVVRPDTDYAETAEPVRVSSGDDWISSVGMQAWFRPPSRINFLSRVEARYVPF